jgi:hypothetical protein
MQHIKAHYEIGTNHLTWKGGGGYGITVKSHFSNMQEEFKLKKDMQCFEFLE